MAVGFEKDAPYVRARGPRGSLAWIVLTAILIAIVCFVGYAMPRLWAIHSSDQALRPALETAIAAAAIVGVILLVGRLRQTRLLRDLMLLVALGAVALNDFIFNALPAYGERTAIHEGSVWIALTTLVAGAFVAAAFVSEHRRVTLTWRRGAVGTAALVAWIASCVAIDRAIDMVTDHWPAGAYGPIWNAIALLCFALLLLSGIRFAHRGGSEDATAKLLTCVAILLAGAELETLAVPVVPGDWLLPGDGLRAAAYATSIAVCVILYRRSLQALAHDALTAERTRIAHDLHDGLAQDLACIAAHSARLAREFGADHPLTLAARRAVAASRGKILDLEASGAPTTAAALREVAAEAEVQFGVQIEVRMQADDQPEPSATERSELIRIAREAIANAARHGNATHITVMLGSRRNELLLRVSDDGSGLPDLDRRRGGGLGMRAMRARARRIGAQLCVRSTCEQGGAEIEVVGAPANADRAGEPRSGRPVRKSAATR
ncbi:MAG TPA: ATP-binding protein [Solirubrobacteraceae bacterium]|nr:ATP-binding protein [Solirubrobacteraceae bacterium]